MRDQGTGRRADRPLGPPGESEHTTQPGPHDVQRVQLPAVVARERLRHDRENVERMRLVEVVGPLADEERLGHLLVPGHLLAQA